MKFLSAAACILGLLLPTGLQARTHKPPGDCRISNGTITIVTSKRFGGAVSGLYYDGKQFINDHDHGRQMQTAWSYNHLGEACNPTEAGSGPDKTGRKSSSIILSAKVRGNTLTTVSHPAYWRAPGKPDAKNLAITTNDTLTRTITLGYNGDPHVLVYDSTVHISPVLTSPPVKVIRIETPATYTTGDFADHYLLNKKTGRLIKAKQDAAQKSGKNRIIPVLTTPGGRYAIASYTPRSKDFTTYNSRSPISPDPENSTRKMTVHFQHQAQAGMDYSYRTFIIVGSLPMIEASLQKLP